MDNVIDLFDWETEKAQKECVQSYQQKINKINYFHFKKLWKNNLRLWLVVGLLLGIVAFQQFQIYELTKSHQQVVVVDNQTDLTGLDVAPIEGLK